MVIPFVLNISFKLHFLFLYCNINFLVPTLPSISFWQCLWNESLKCVFSSPNTSDHFLDVLSRSIAYLSVNVSFHVSIHFLEREILPLTQVRENICGLFWKNWVLRHFSWAHGKGKSPFPEQPSVGFRLRDGSKSFCSSWLWYACTDTNWIRQDWCLLDSAAIWNAGVRKKQWQGEERWRGELIPTILLRFFAIPSSW